MKIIKGENLDYPLIVIIMVLIFGFIIPSLVPSVNAQTVYNWVQNSGFEDGIGLELINNGNFESGISDGWYDGGVGSPIYIYTSFSVSPTNCLGVPLNAYAWYNFSEPIPVAWIKTFSFYVRSLTGSYTCVFRFYYSDESYTDVNYNMFPNNVWNLRSGVPSFDAGKNIVALRIDTNSVSGYFDDISMTSYMVGQTEINEGTLPWYDRDFNDVDVNGKINFTTGVAHSGNAVYSDKFGDYAIIYTRSYFPLPINSITWNTIVGAPIKIRQDIPFLDTNTIEKTGFWVYVTNEGVQQYRMSFQYSDGTWSEDYQSFASFEQWSFLDFTTIIRENKYLVAFGLDLVGGDGYTENGGVVYIDDVVIESTLPVGSNMIEWFVNPEPLTYDSDSFTQYFGIPCQFIFNVYDENSSLTENGTYTVSTASETLQGDIINGEFSFNIGARTGSIDRTETLQLTLSIDGKGSFIIKISAYWKVGTPDTSNLYPTPSNGINGLTPEQIAIRIDFSLLFIYLFLPSFILAGFTFKAGMNPLIGFVGGLFFMVVLGYSTKLIVDLWIVFGSFILMVFCGIGILKGVGRQN